MAVERDRDRDVQAVQPRGGGGGGVVGWLIAFLVVVALVIAGIVAWAALTDDEGAGADVGVTVSDVTSDPEEYYGVGVTVSGEVNEVVAPNALTLGGEGFFGGEELLIVSAEGIPLPAGFERDADESVLEGDIVQVTGTVREFILVEVEEETGLDLDDATFEEFEGQPAIVASSVSLTPRLSDVPAGAISIEAINENEEVFDGQEVTLNGTAGDLWAPGAFLLQSGGEEDETFAVAEEQLLVIGAPDAVPAEIVEGVPVDVTGVVRLIDEDNEEALIEEEFGFDIEDGVLDAWEDEPVLIATSITAGATEATVELERIMTDALGYVGTQVTTGGVVEEVLLPQAFRLTTEDDDAVVDTEVLVVGGEGVFGEAVVDQAYVQVTGTPYLFDADFEAEFGDDFGFLWEDEAFDDLDEGSLVIVADSIQVAR